MLTGIGDFFMEAPVRNRECECFDPTLDRFTQEMLSMECSNKCGSLKVTTTDLTAEFRVRQAISQLDLKVVKKKLTRLVIEGGGGWDEESANDVEKAYKDYLKLCALNPSKSFTPNQDVDEMWHTHILFTRKYHDDCHAIFGYYLHHTPNMEGCRAEGACWNHCSDR